MNITITMTQSRSAMATNRAGSTKYNILKNVESTNGDIGLSRAGERMYADKIGEATVIHPAILIGSQDEIDYDMRKAIMAEIARQPGITANEYGVLFA